MAANQGGVEFDCAPDGSFRPLQCQTGVENLLRCICVDPRDGKLIVGTSVTVTRRDDAPNCDRLGKHSGSHFISSCMNDLP